MRNAIAWILDHALVIVVGWFGFAAVGYAVVATFSITDWSDTARLIELAKMALPTSGLGLALVGAAEAIDRLSPQARVYLHWINQPTTSWSPVPFLEIENRSAVEARKVELTALISIRRRWPAGLGRLLLWRTRKREREERDRVRQHFDYRLFNHIEFWPTAEEDPQWKRPEQDVRYPNREAWLLDQPLAPGQKVQFEPRLGKRIIYEIAKADESINGIDLVVSTSTGRGSVLKDRDLVSVMRAWGLR